MDGPTGLLLVYPLHCIHIIEVSADPCELPHAAPAWIGEVCEGLLLPPQGTHEMILAVIDDLKRMKSEK